MKNIQTHRYISTKHELTFTFREWLSIFFNGLLIEAKPEKEIPFKEWQNGDKVIVINNQEENIWTGVIVDEDAMIHDVRLPVYKDDVTGELCQCGGIFVVNDPAGINLTALKKLDWNERWNLLAHKSKSVIPNDHFRKQDIDNNLNS